MRFLTDVLFSAIDATVDATSSAVDTSQVFKASLMVVAAGGATGAVKLQASNDAPTTGSPTNWVDIPNASSTISANGVTLIPAFDCAYRYIQAKFTHTGVAGTVTAKLQTQGF